MLLLLQSCTQPAPVDEDPRFTELVSWTRHSLAEWAVPGASIAVVADGQVHLAGVGVTHYGTLDAVTPDDLFRIGSISKMFTGALVAEEIVAGRLDLAAPVSQALTGLTMSEPHSYDDVTLLQILGHFGGMQTTGLPRMCDTDPATMDAQLQELSKEWAFWTPPGELYSYSNQDYALLGLAAERSRGQPFVDMAQELFDGAGMSSATYDWVAATAAPHAVGHSMNPFTDIVLGYRTFDERACSATYPSGGLMASGRDMAGLLQVLLHEGEGWVSPEGWALMTTEGYARTETGGYGFGLQSSSWNGLPSLTHHGSLGGYFAMVYVVPSEGLGVAVMVNADHLVTDPPTPWAKPSQRIVEHALNTFLGTEPVERTSSALSVEEWGRYVGFYHSDYELGDVAVSLVDGELLYSNAGVTHVLLPYGRDSFQYATPLDDGRIQYTGVSFADDDEGTILWLVADIGIAARR